MTKSELVISLSEAFELPPNAVEAELTDIDRALPEGHPGFDYLFLTLQNPIYDEERASFMKAIIARFNTIRITRLIKDTARQLSKGTHLSPEQVEAYLMTTPGDEKKRKAFAKAFVDNFCFAAVQHHRQSSAQ